MRIVLAAIFALILIAPTSVSAMPLPAVVIPCGTQARVGYFSYNPPGATQTYQISFDAQGNGLARLHESPVYQWVDTPINSPSSPTHFSFQVTIDRYPGRPTELFLDGNAASCAVNPAGLTITNVSISAVVQRSKITPH